MRVFYYLLKNVYSSNGIHCTRLRLYIAAREGAGGRGACHLSIFWCPMQYKLYMHVCMYKKGQFMNILSQYLPFLTGNYNWNDEKYDVFLLLETFRVPHLSSLSGSQQCHSPWAVPWLYNVTLWSRTSIIKDLNPRCTDDHSLCMIYSRIYLRAYDHKPRNKTALFKVLNLIIFYLLR